MNANKAFFQFQGQWFGGACVFGLFCFVCALAGRSCWCATHSLGYCQVVCYCALMCFIYVVACVVQGVASFVTALKVVVFYVLLRCFGALL